MVIFTSQLHSADPPGTLPKPCNAGIVDMEWVTEDLTKSEVQQSLRNGVLRIQRIPLQGFSTVPAKSVLAVYRIDGVGPCHS